MIYMYHFHCRKMQILVFLIRELSIFFKQRKPVSWVIKICTLKHGSMCCYTHYSLQYIEVLSFTTQWCRHTSSQTCKHVSTFWASFSAAVSDILRMSHHLSEAVFCRRLRNLASGKPGSTYSRGARSGRREFGNLLYYKSSQLVHDP